MKLIITIPDKHDEPIDVELEGTGATVPRNREGPILSLVTSLLRFAGHDAKTGVLAASKRAHDCASANFARYDRTPRADLGEEITADGVVVRKEG